MRSKPEYRVRLFLSVDLVGSTAFKVRNSEPSGPESPDPMWVDKVKRFYREFPRIVKARFSKLSTNIDDCRWNLACPVVWKTIGDEIVFCCKLEDVEHLCCCMKSFLEALRQYGEELEKASLKLDVKGYGWVAAFPSPNVTVDVYSASASASEKFEYELPTEELEAAADKNPHQFDFLGKNIDSGFRIGRLCSVDEFTLSVELAYLLALASKDQIPSPFTYLYSGRQMLKGVLNDRPYPVISLDVGRSHKRALVRQRERQLYGSGNEPTPLGVHDFLAEFFDDENIDLPSIEYSKRPIPRPGSYSSYESAWAASNEELVQRTKQEAAAAMQPENDGAAKIPTLISRWSEERFASAEESSSPPVRRKRRRRR